MTHRIAKPQPPPERVVVQLNIRVSPEGREMIRDLAEAENLTLQQLGIYAWNLALAAYGRRPLPEEDQ